MATSYFDLLPAYVPQAAAADALARQSANNLAVLPAANIRPGLREAAQRGLQARELALNARRLRLEEDRQAFAQSQVPLGIAGGLASGALQLYGGVRALEQQERDAMLSRQILAQQQANARLTQESNASLARALGEINAANRAAITPVPVTPILLP